MGNGKIIKIIITELLFVYYMTLALLYKKREDTFSFYLYLSCAMVSNILLIAI
jgi:hypothetical protein